jgi:O-methyltransferase domain
MMAAYTASKPNETNHLVAGYDWGGLGNALVVDVGGSLGHISTILARAYPQLSFVVQDLPAAIAKVSLPSELAQRVRIEAHDFFSPQTVVADVYYFRWIFHNWADSDAVRILRALIPALRDGARVVIHDDCMPDARSVAQWREKVMRCVINPAGERLCEGCAYS